MSESDPLAGAAQEWYKKGTDAMNRQNYDFATECFFNAIKMKPDALLFRQVRHLSIQKNYGDNGTGAKMAGMKLMGVRGKIKKAKIKSDWKALDTAAEEGLLINPWDGQLYADLGEASEKLERGEIAAYAYRQAVKSDISNIDFNRGLGNVLRNRHEYKEARQCFKRIYEADPTDSDARSMLSRLDAEEVMNRQGYQQAESTQDVKAEKPANAYEEDRRARRGQKQEAAAPGESDEMDVRARIRKEPKNVAHYLKLADLLRDERRLTESMEVFDQALEISGNDIAIVEQKEDVELELMRDKVTEAVDRARKNPERERLAEKAKAMKADLLAREIETFASRIERHPNDMKMRFELADRYRKTKQYKAAIPLLQQATADSRLKEDALVMLGECFVRTGSAKLSVRQFEKALETLNAKDKPDSFKGAHYWLGRIYEQSGDNDQAENHYSEIVSVDIRYRDAHKRLEEIQGADEFADIVDIDD